MKPTAGFRFLIAKPFTVRNSKSKQGSKGASWELKAACWSPKKGLRVVDEAEVVGLLRKPGGILWVDVYAHDPTATYAFLVDQLGFHPLAVEDALYSHERPHLQEYDSTVFLAAHAVQIQQGDEHYIQVGFFVNKHFLVLVRREPVPLIEQWFDRWREHPRLVGPTPAHLLHTLLDAIVDDYFPISDQLQEAADELEEHLFRNKRRVEVADILRTKRRLLEFRRHITPLRDILNSLLRRGTEVIPLEVMPYLQDVYDHTLRLTESMDLSRDILSGVLDAHLSIVSNRLNDIMRVLTVISTLLMTMALIAGIYGMNFVYLPELRWRWGYPLSLGIMALAAIIELIIFRRKGWI